MVVRELLTRWGFAIDDRKLDGMDRKIGVLKSAVGVLTGAIASAGTAVSALVLTTARAGDEIAKSADRMGIGIEALQRMRYAADMAGISNGDLQTSLRFLLKNASDAATGSGIAAEAFRDMGVAVTEGGKLLAGDELMRRVIAGLEGISDPAKRVNLAMATLGRSGTQMLSLLRDGVAGWDAAMAEADALGAVMSEEAARNSEQFMDSLSRAKYAMLGLERTIGAAFLPEATRMLGVLKEWLVANRETIRSKVSEAIRVIGKVMAATGAAILTAVRSVAALVEACGGLERVLKAVGIALAGLALFHLGSATMRWAKAIAAVVTNLRAAGGAAMMLNVKALLLPIALGAAIVLLGLLAEDMYRFHQGDESLVGRWESEARGFWKNLLGGFDLIDLLGTAILRMGDAFAYAREQLTLFNNAFQSITGLGKGDLLKTALGSLPGVGVLMQAVPAAQFLTTPGSLSMGSGSVPAAATAPANVTVNAPVTFQVPPGTTTEQQTALDKQLENWWTLKMRSSFAGY